MGIDQDLDGAQKPPARSAVLAGIGLLVLGVLWIAAQFLDLNLGAIFWPWFVIVPGLVLLVWGVAARERGGLGLCIAGSITTLTGVLLFYQSISGHWTSWAYAWALVAPGGVGLGQILHGITANDSGALRAGSRLLVISAAIFVVGLLFFEVLIGISGFGLDFWAWPFVLVAVGLGLLAYGMLRQRN